MACGLLLCAAVSEIFSRRAKQFHHVDAARRATTASVNSADVAAPPRSRGLMPSAKVRNSAASMARAAACSPRWSSIITPLSSCEQGLAAVAVTCPKIRTEHQTDALALDIGRAAVGRLKQRVLVAKVAAAAQAQRPNQPA